MPKRRIYSDPHQGITRMWTGEDEGVVEWPSNQPQRAPTSGGYQFFGGWDYPEGKGFLNTPRSDATLGATENDEMASAPTREEIDAKIGTAKAEVDTEFAKLRADLRHLPTTGALIATVASGVVAVIGVLLAVMAFGGDRFDGGLAASGIVTRVQEEQRIVDARQDAQLQEMNGKLDVILDRLPKTPE